MSASGLAKLFFSMVIFIPRVGTGSVRLELIERSQTSQIEEILVATFVFVRRAREARVPASGIDGITRTHKEKNHLRSNKLKCVFNY